VQVNAGVPTVTEYLDVIRSPYFLELERASRGFVVDNRSELQEYGRLWSLDPLHRWSRQYEYPFVDVRLRERSAQRAAPLKVLDAGSGCTFFPFHLVGDLGCDLSCADSGDVVERTFRRIEAKRPGGPRFERADIRSLPFEDGSFDAVYCISVLEHTEEYPTIIREFARVLGPGGLLLVTFDISVDGASQIPVAGAERLVANLDDAFEPLETPTAPLGDLVKRPDTVTTNWTRGFDRRLLPWKFPVLSSIKNGLQMRRVPRALLPSLAFCCTAYTAR
jgi:SAM-dependent methyltransferase